MTVLALILTILMQNWVQNWGQFQHFPCKSDSRVSRGVFLFEAAEFYLSPFASTFLLILGTHSGGHDGTRSLAAENFAKKQPVTADELVGTFRHINDAGNPEDECHRDHKGQAQSHKTQSSSPPVNTALAGDTVDGFEQVVSVDAGCQ
jgi:hypothetical protein